MTKEPREEIPREEIPLKEVGDAICEYYQASIVDLVRPIIEKNALRKIQTASSLIELTTILDEAKEVLSWEVLSSDQSMILIRDRAGELVRVARSSQ